MGNIVITGSTRGIGRGLAVEFLKRGHNVVVSSRQSGDVTCAVRELTALKLAKVAGKTCDVTEKNRCKPCGTSPLRPSERWISGSTMRAGPLLATQSMNCPKT